MDRYIGLDAHSSSCTLGVLGPSGKRLGSRVVETNAKALIEVLRSIPGPRHPSKQILVPASRPESPPIGYAPLESRTKRWATESLYRRMVPAPERRTNRL
jgi:hypothetical protein